MGYTIGSLFDGSGGFPLAASLCGMTPLWASEIEPYPIAVTRSRFPNMKHLGDISKINGAEVAPVDIITFGSPCQDLSVAGKRAGLKHEANGDEETTRSGLFMEAVRIIREMREATNGRYPAFALWENVPGAFSSNKGEDFRIVCEELVKIVEPRASMPPVPKNGWNYADSFVGDGWSLAYRVFDAQYWGVPQRRRRIHLVLDLRGECAREVLFEREGVRGYFAEGRTPWQTAPADAERGAGADDCQGIDGYNAALTGDKSATLGVNCGVSTGRNGVLVPYTLKIRSGCEGGGKGALVQTDKSATLATNNDQYLFQPVIPINDKATRWKGGGASRNQDGSGNGLGVGQEGDPSPTLTGGDRHAVAYSLETFHCTSEEEKVTTLKARDWKDPNVVAFTTDAVHYIVRRLTPTECARLQGFADRWGDVDAKDDFTDEEYAFWHDVRNTHATVIGGKEAKDYTKAQMLTWYNKLHTDSAEYKLWGNGIALPPALYCMQGIAEALDSANDNMTAEAEAPTAESEDDIKRELRDLSNKLRELMQRFEEACE